MCRQQQDYISSTSLGLSLWSLLDSIGICKKIWTTLLSLYTNSRKLLLIKHILPQSWPCYYTPKVLESVFVKSSKLGWLFDQGS